YLWVNPVFSGAEPPPTLTGLDATGTDLTDVATVALRQGGTTTAPSLIIDGLRIATSWTALWAAGALEPEIFVTGTLEDFISIAGSPSASQSYSLRGEDLLTSITVTPPDGYELSTNNATWLSSLSLPSSYDDLVYVRLNADVAGVYAGFIAHTSGSATPVNLRVDGEALEASGEIIATHDLQTFYSTAGVPSAIQTVAVETVDLSQPLYVYLPALSPYQVRESPTRTWTDLLELPFDFAGDIEVRFNPSASGTFNSTLFLESDGAPLVEIPLTGIATIGVSTIAQLRGSSIGSVYTLTGEAVLTFKQTFRNQKYIQDGTAAILIDDNSGVITTAYNLNDGITGITGTLGTFGGMLQFVPTRDPGAATSSGNTIVPQEISLAQLLSNFEDYESELVKVLSVSFSSTGNFANGIVYLMNDGVTDFNFRTTFYDVDYIGTAIPTIAKNIIGLPNSRTEGNFFTARNLADFSDATAPNPPTKLAVTNINPASPYANTAFSVTVQAQDAGGVPRNVTTDTQVTLSLATGTGILSGTLTGTILQNSNSVTISGVLYNTAEAGVSVTATATSGMTLTAGTSATFTVQSIPAEPTVTVLSRPAYVDISTVEGESAVLMQLQTYPTDDVRYRLYNGSFQYNCWNGTQYVTSSSYGDGPAVPGSSTTSTSWWVLYQRGNNNSTSASYRDRLGPDYTSNYKTIALPAAAAVADPFTVAMTLPLDPGLYPLDVKYVILGYDAETGGTLLTATSSALTTGEFTLVAETGTTIRRIEVRSITNILMESLTGEWDGGGSGGYYGAVEGLSGTALRAGLKTITSTGHINNSWDATRYHIYATLDNVNDQVRCIYTGVWFAHPAGGQYTPTGLSVEHSYPREWFSGHAEYNWCDTDLNALFPADESANSSRSNYPFDYVTTILTPWGSGSYLSYRGNNAAGDPVFEVADEFKGNIARAIFYFGMRYYDDDTNFQRLNVNLVPILKQWHTLDPVDATETVRNDGVYAFQGNRNPFIDHPEWIQSIWGSIPITAPVATAATSVDAHGFTANWDAVAGATSYRVDISTSSTFAGFVNARKNVTVSGTSYPVSGLSPNTNYYYRVRALDSSGNLSLHSNTINVITTIGGEVIYYWNFNDNLPASGENWAQPIPAQTGSGSISYDFTQAVSYTGTTLNGVSGEVNGGSLAPLVGDGNINNGKHFEVSMPTTGYQDIIFTYATRGTSTGFNSQEVQYSINGTDFVTKTTFSGTLENNWVTGQIRSVDFSDVPAAENNPNFKVRIVVSGGSSPTGNNRFDNIKVYGAAGGGQLDPPQNVQIVIVAGEVQLSWNAVTGATGYLIQASNDPYTGFTTVETIGAVTNWSTAV
ncbi:MAG: endonuclease, partial [Candidatus Cloacimonetes bacterium]|nr:endonuclease [Candidatus Cloacimonadota bacterium]